MAAESPTPGKSRKHAHGNYGATAKGYTQQEQLAADSLEAILLRMTSGKELITIKELAEMLGVDYKTAYRAVTDEGLPAGRFKKSMYFISIFDIAKYLKMRGTNMGPAEQPLETLLGSLDQLNPHDWQLRQAVDGYIQERAEEAVAQYALQQSYATAFAKAEVNHWLSGIQGKPKIETKDVLTAAIRDSLANK
jgi:DNA-binding transcriptional regulator YhcF (GntR family)